MKTVSVAFVVLVMWSGFCWGKGWGLLFKRETPGAYTSRVLHTLVYLWSHELAKSLSKNESQLKGDVVTWDWSILYEPLVCCIGVHTWYSNPFPAFFFHWLLKLITFGISGNDDTNLRCVCVCVCVCARVCARVRACACACETLVCGYVCSVYMCAWCSWPCIYKENHYSSNNWNYLPCTSVHTTYQLHICSNLMDTAAITSSTSLDVSNSCLGHAGW